MAAGNADEKTSASVGSSSKAGSGLVMVLSLVNLLATLAMVVILFLSFQREKQHASVEDMVARTPAEAESDKEKSKEGKEGKEGGEKSEEKKKTMDYGKMITLDQFTVNLATVGSVNAKFVRVNISLEVATEDIEAEVMSKMPQVRNTIIDLFNSKRASDLAAADGRDFLKEEIRNAINSFLISGKIKGVYFTSFALAN